MRYHFIYFLQIEKLLIFVVFILLSGCSIVEQQTMDVIELDFGKSHENCEKLFITSGEGANQEKARNKVKESVISAGGNAVVYVGARIKLNPKTKEMQSYTSRAIIYKCKTF